MAGWRGAWVLVAVLAVGGCSGSGGGEATPAASATAAVAGDGLAAVTDRWCLAEPGLREDVCVTVDLPTVVADASPDAISYVYLDGDDPRELTAGDYAISPNREECWEASVDAYPSTNAAMFLYCPGGAASGLDWVDSPSNLEGAFLGVDVADVLAMDRLYLVGEQAEADVYPYLREPS
ncbi:hypothetical protein [Demequina silvatica]|uniref:hypothetical protein n=1 Tax=Demequina silvatica TaxID=1638988 RepID=UPI000784063C|nr:hypothetical protein [Demequina silvatica]